MQIFLNRKLFMHLICYSSIASFFINAGHNMLWWLSNVSDYVLLSEISSLFADCEITLVILLQW